MLSSFGYSHLSDTLSLILYLTPKKEEDIILSLVTSYITQEAMQQCLQNRCELAVLSLRWVFGQIKSVITHL